MRSLYISALHRSSGKTVFAAGLCQVLRASGLTVQSFKKGPDYIDPMWLTYGSRKPCINLDFNTMTAGEIRETFSRYGGGQDCALVEGSMGLFDGVDARGADSNAALAKLLGIPVLLVIDCTGMTRGIAPMLLGHTGFDEQLRIAGVILNNVMTARHESKLRGAIEQYTDVEVFGAIRRQPELVIPERHLGLTTDREDREAETHLRAIRDAVRDCVDIERLMARAAAPCMDRPPEPGPAGNGLHGIRLGIAWDAAFCFYYADDLETLERAGARLCRFSPLQDTGLPDADALLIGGGFPETHAGRLHRNRPMRRAVHDFCSSGRPVYAECGGLMYLGRKLSWNGRSHDMVGFLPADTVMHERPQGRGHVELQARSCHPWLAGGAAGLLPGGGTLKAHEFHHSSLENIGSGVEFAWRVKRGHGVDGRHDGLMRHGTLAGYTHLRNAASSPWIRLFAGYVGRCRGRAGRTAGPVGGPA